MVLPLGPKFLPQMTGRQLYTPRLTAASFGKNFTVRLPVTPDGWAYTEPQKHEHWIAVAGSDLYFRLATGFGGQGFLDAL